MQVQGLTPVLFVDAIEPCLSFWIARLGYELQVHVHEGDRYGFVILVRDEVPIMYQTHESLAKDLPQLQNVPGTTFVYLTVDDLDHVERALADVERVQERRKTFYGAHEIAVREPGGHVVVFAQHEAH